MDQYGCVSRAQWHCDICLKLCGLAHTNEGHKHYMKFLLEAKINNYIFYSCKLKIIAIKIFCYISLWEKENTKSGRIHAGSANLRQKTTRFIYMAYVFNNGADERMVDRNEYTKRKIQTKMKKYLSSVY